MLARLGAISFGGRQLAKKNQIQKKRIIMFRPGVGGGDLEKIWHLIGFVEGGVMAAGGDSEVSQVCHKSVAFPTEEEFDFHSAKTVGIQCSACADSEGLGGPEL